MKMEQNRSQNRRIRKRCVTKDVFYGFEIIRMEGKHNMATEWKTISTILGIDPTAYIRLLERYDKYAAKWADVVKDVEKNYWIKIDKSLK